MTGPDVRFETPQPLTRLAYVLICLGIGGFSIGLATTPDASWTNLLLVGFLGVGFGLAGGLLMAFQYLTAAGWSVALRRVPEAMASLVAVGGLLVVLALVAYPEMYPWTSEATEPHSDFRDAWLNRPFFLARSLVYVAIWMGSIYALVHTSRRQDEDDSPAHTIQNRRWSALFVVLFGITFWLASYDWVMSREPEWTSTVFGPYNFAGLFVSGLAVCILLVIWLRQCGPFRAILSEDHLHDLGKLLFGMSTFWAYLWYCQYMLIWYVNNPEETPYYLRRLQGVLEPLFYINLALNWIVPFLLLLPRSAKRSAKRLVQVCVVVLLGRWLDLYLMILPADHGMGSLMIGLSMTLGAMAGYFLLVVRALSRAALVPCHDPYLMESLPRHASAS